MTRMEKGTSELLKVAKALRLTDRQFNFALALAGNGGNQTKAAEAVGVDSGRSAVQGSKWARFGKVKAMVTLLTAEAQRRAEKKTDTAIADLAECLAFNTMVKRSKAGDYITDEGLPDIAAIKAAPAGLIRGVELSTSTSEEGLVTTRGKVVQESALAANNRLIDHYEQLEDGKRSEGLFAQVLMAQPPAVVAAIARAMLAGPKPIEIPAKVIE